MQTVHFCEQKKSRKKNNYERKYCRSELDCLEKVVLEALRICETFPSPFTCKLASCL